MPAKPGRRWGLSRKQRALKGVWFESTHRRHYMQLYTGVDWYPAGNGCDRDERLKFDSSQLRAWECVIRELGVAELY